MKKKIHRCLAIFLVFSLPLIGLGGCASEATLQKTKGEPSFTIATSFYPMYIMAANIAKEVPGVELVSLAPADLGCLHDIQLSPADLKLLEGSDVFVVNGLGMEEYLTKVTEQFPQLKTIDSTRDLGLVAGPEETPHQEEADQGHDHEGEINPHTWVSLTLAMKQVQTIGSELAKLDPTNAALYQKNTEAYLGQLQDVKTRMEQAVGKATSPKKMVTFHESFEYLAEELGIEIVAKLQSEDGAEPSAKELAETIERVREEQVKVIFVEPQFPDGIAQTLARETGAKIYTLDPATTGPDEPAAYLQAMEKNLLTLVEAFQE